jgi:hypothetical protein
MMYKSKCNLQLKNEPQVVNIFLYFFFNFYMKKKTCVFSKMNMFSTLIIMQSVREWDIV